MIQDFCTGLKESVTKEKSVTENGAIAYENAGNELLDLNFKTTEFRTMPEKDIIKLFLISFFADKMNTMKWLFFLRDVRGGMGERRAFRVIVKNLAKSGHQDVIKPLLTLIPEYGRWDDLLCLLDTDLGSDVLALIKDQIMKDIEAVKDEKQTVSLLAKWLPSINTSSQESRRLAKRVAKYLKWDDATYRKTLSELRKKIDVLERKACANEWSQIVYGHVPSMANLKYKEAFIKHDPERRRKYLADLSVGKEKIHSGVCYPHDILQRYYYLQKVDDALENMWKALPTYGDPDGNTICVMDGSGSMQTTLSGNLEALTVAQALSIYFAERMTGPFKDSFITFSSHPRLVSLDGCKNLFEKYQKVKCYTEISNTDIAKTMDLILNTAIKNNAHQKDIPNILILSDMQFDAATCGSVSKSLFESIADKWRTNGYKLPKITFWNIVNCGNRPSAVPMQSNESGLCLVSGFSPTVAKMVYSCKEDPLEVLLEMLNCERYAPVENILKPVL